MIGIGSWIVLTQNDTDAMGNMGADAGALPPPVTGYYDGERIQFLHTETSEPDGARGPFGFQPDVFDTSNEPEIVVNMPITTWPGGERQ
ncbi:hypothetical protein [Haloechinothrix salitolerans]|uniref:Uncharacterized protein n=1 Tax=Haloechinothrix salitolerans TaxID=926830 RepID=A0ABW2C6T9_9PSEU